MAIILSEILPQFSTIQVDLVAGSGGTQAPVTWVHVVEAMEIVPFLGAGELAFMTGLAVRDDCQLLDLVEAIACHGASGLIVNLGPFIQAVPPQVVAFANEKNFPIFTAPWQVRLPEIMRIITLEITALNLRDMELEVAMKRMILSPETAQAQLAQLQNYMVAQEGSFACVVAQFSKEETNVPQERLDEIKVALQTHLHYAYKQITPLTVYNKMVLVVPQPNRKLVGELVAFCQEKVPLLPGETVNSCVGNTVQGIENLSESFEKASRLLVKKFEKDGRVSNLFFYDDMGLYALLAEVGNPAALRQFYQTTVEPLVLYDQSHGTDLLDILRLYLHHNASVKAVAEETYLHRNTVNYKLGKIGEILGLNLSDLQGRVNLSVGLAIYDLLP